MYYAGHTVWFHNKMLPGTFGEAYITIDGAEVIGKGSWAHKGFHIDVDDAITDYNITFSVEATTKGDKLRGPFKNDRDYEWKFTGSIDIWNIHQLS